MARIDISYDDEDHLTVKFLELKNPRNLVVDISERDFGKLTQQLSSALSVFLSESSVVALVAKFKFLKYMRKFVYKGFVVELNMRN